MSTSRWKRNPNVVARRIGADTILVPTGRDIVDHRSLFTLNDTGSFIWETLSSPCSTERLHEALVATFDVEADQARVDLQAFLERLSEAGCIREE